MTTLANALAIGDTVMTVSPALDVGNYPAPFTIDSEAILVTGGDNTTSLSVQRGQNGTARAAHAKGATVTANWGGGGAISATDGINPPEDITAIVAPGAVVAAGTMTTQPIIISETDPGTVGAGQFWLRVVPDLNAAIGLYVRNLDDDGWDNTVMSSVGIDISPGEIRGSLWDVVLGNRMADFKMAGLDGLSDQGFVNLTIAKNDNNNYILAQVRLGQTNNSIELAVYDGTSGDFIAGLTLDADGISLPGLPTADPLVAGALYSDGVPSAGVPKPFMVSGG